MELLFSRSSLKTIADEQAHQRRSLTDDEPAH